MKRVIAILLTVICLLSLVACGTKENGTNSTDDKGTQTYFIAKVVQIEDETMLIEVTDKGNSGTSVGNQVRIPTEKVAATLADNPAMVTDNYVRIEFDGNVMETYPLQLGEVTQIIITNESGTSIE